MNKANIEKKNVPVALTESDNQDVLNRVRNITTIDDPNSVLREVKNQLDKDLYKQEMKTDGIIFKAVSLHEFEKGALLSTAVMPKYRTFAIDMLRKLQKEHKCISVSEKSLVEVAVLNLIQIMEIQTRIANYLNLGTISQVGVNFLNVLSKELDRANRRYITTLQVLKSINQPEMTVNIKTSTAVVGQNQVVQSENK